VLSSILYIQFLLSSVPLWVCCVAFLCQQRCSESIPVTLTEKRQREHHKRIFLSIAHLRSASRSLHLCVLYFYTMAALPLKFRCEVRDIEARDLVTQHRTCSPYVVLDFEGYKRMTTDAVNDTANPCWSFSANFTYETRHSTHLHNEYLSIECYDGSKGKKKDLIGRVAVDLHTLCTGPIQQHLTLQNDTPVRVGTISLSVTFKEIGDIHIVFRNLSYRSEERVGEEVYAQYRYISNDPETRQGKQWKSEVARKTGPDWHWYDLPEM